MPTSGKARRWTSRFLLATELTVIVFLVLGGCHSKQNYRVLSPQAGDEVLNKCNVVVEGRVAYVSQKTLKSWAQHLFCYPLTSEGPEGPDRYNVSIDIDQVLKGDPDMPRRLQVDSCRPPTPQEGNLLGQLSFPQGLRVRIGFNSQHGNSFRNLTIVPLGLIPTTQRNFGQARRTPDPGR